MISVGHVLDHVLDHMILDLVTTTLYLCNIFNNDINKKHNDYKKTKIMDHKDKRITNL